MNKKNRPHGTQSHFVGQVCIVRQQGGEKVLGKGVHGNALPVDDLTKTAEWTRCSPRRRQNNVRFPSSQCQR